MFYREPEGIQVSNGDVCRHCLKFEGGGRVCLATGIFLKEALVKGMHLDVIYCPHRHPPLGENE